MDREHLCESLFLWLQTCSVSGPQDTIEDLADGVAMANVLQQIAPNFFNDVWLSKIKHDTSGNWRVKVSNLKKVLKGILDYYSEVLTQQIHDFHMPDVTAIGEKADAGELGRLLQLILGCAVNCDAKQEYIQKIMGMEESEQVVVMNAIQELMTKETSAAPGEGSSELSEQLKHTVEELNKVAEEKEELHQRCHELDLQIAALQEEKGTLEVENEKLNERVSQADSLDDPSTPAGRRYQQLQAQVEHLEEELYRQESSRDDYRIKVELVEKENLELQQKNEELNSLAEEARSLKDEIDVLRHTSDKVAKYEATIESYKKKLEEMSDLKGQLKILEEKNTSYMQQNMELEEDIRKSSTIKSQLEMYKRQVQELQLKSTDETKRADKAEFEAKRHTDKLQTLQQEKSRLVEERDSLRDTLDELRGTRAQQEVIYQTTEPVAISINKDVLDGGQSDLDGSGMVDLMAMPHDIKEKFLRLQHENKMLKLQKSASDDENSQLLQTMLEDANARKSELESENRILNQRIMELQAQIEDIQENQQEASKTADNSSSELRKKLSEQLQKYKEMNSELSKHKQNNEDLETKLLTCNEEIGDLKTTISKKEDEMRSMEERYKVYLEKAKAVIKSLDPKNNPGSGPEIQALRNQLQEKERLIEHLEKEHDKAKSIREQEEKLMVTAWYNLGMNLHKKATDDRLNNIGTGQSFLARQRQVHTRRTQSMNTPHATNMAGAR